MANFDYIGDVHRAMAGGLPRSPQPHLRTPRKPRRRPRWLGGRPL